MSTDEINRIIAKYMNTIEIRTIEADYYMGIDKEVESYPLYTDSLDELIPVVDSLAVISKGRLKTQSAATTILQLTNSIFLGTNPSLELATNCYKVIEEIN